MPLISPEGERHDRRGSEDRGAAGRSRGAAFDLLNAVSKGTLDGGHGVFVYHYGKNNALSLWGSSPRTGWTPTCCSPGTNTAAARNCSRKSTMPSASVSNRTPTARCGRSPGLVQEAITKADDFKGLKFRTVVSRSTCSRGWARRQRPARRRDRAGPGPRPSGRGEFNNASSDRLLGFADVSKVCMLQSYHQSAESFEILFNKAKFDALPAKMKAIIDNASKLHRRT